MCNPVLAAGLFTAGATAYSANRQSKAADEALTESQRQADMAAEAERIRLAEETRIQEAALAAQRAAQAQQQRAFAAQQAAARRAAEEAKQGEIRRQTNIGEGQTAISDLFGQFNNDFYTGRAKAYQDYATPQLEKQYNEAMNTLTRSLSRSGNLNSSVRGQTMADLQRQYQEGLASIASQGTNYANQARASVEAARSDLLSRNASLADPGLIRSLAQSQAGTLSSAPTYTPIGSLINALMANSGEVAGVNKATDKKNTGVGLIANELTTGTGQTIQ